MWRVLPLVFLSRIGTINVFKSLNGFNVLKRLAIFVGIGVFHDAQVAVIA